MRTKNLSLLFVGILFMNGCATFAKLDQSKPIEKESILLGNTYKQGGILLEHDDLVEKLSVNVSSKDEMSGFQTLYWSSVIAASAGGIMIGWPIGTKVSGGTPDWTTAYIGAGLAVVGAYIGVLADGKMGRAVDLYNHKLKSTSKSEIQFFPVLEVVSCFDRSSNGYLGGLGIRF